MSRPLGSIQKKTDKIVLQTRFYDGTIEEREMTAEDVRISAELHSIQMTPKGLYALTNNDTKHGVFTADFVDFHGEMAGTGLRGPMFSIGMFVFDLKGERCGRINRIVRMSAPSNVLNLYGCDGAEDRQR